MAKATKPKPAATDPGKASPHVLHLLQMEDETESQSLARVSTLPSVLAATAINRFTNVGAGILLEDLVSELGKQVEAVQGGNLARAESLLVSQAHTLDAIFNSLASRAALNMGEYMNAAETYLRLALKAQSQCRTTLETLATIKNPTAPTFVRQANIAHGPQQVNNGEGELTKASPACARAHGKSGCEPNELSTVEGITHEEGQRLDFGASAAAGRADQAMATVETIHWP